MILYRTTSKEPQIGLVERTQTSTENGLNRSTVDNKETHEKVRVEVRGEEGFNTTILTIYRTIQGDKSPRQEKRKSDKRDTKSLTH